MCGGLNLLEHLKDNKVIKGSRHGFVKKRSHQTALVSLFEEETGRADKEAAANGPYSDFSKADATARGKCCSGAAAVSPAPSSPEDAALVPGGRPCIPQGSRGSIAGVPGTHRTNPRRSLRLSQARVALHLQFREQGPCTAGTVTLGDP